MRKLLVLLLIGHSLLAWSQKKSNAADNRLAGIEEKLQTLLADWHAAGFAVAVVEKNKLVYAKGFGYRDEENKKPVTPNTLFAIGSCTKAFTAGLLGILRNDNKVSFNEKPATYVPKLNFFNDEMNAGITVKDLMRHSTGLPRHDLSWYFFNTPDKDSLVGRIQYMEPSVHVREKWQYNNFMFLVQGVITEKITGNSWEKNISEKFFKPLVMSTSNASIAELEKSNEPAVGYEVKNDKDIVKMDYYNISGMAPAGSINSSVNEMANWLRMWIHGGKFNGKEILPASYVSEAISSQMIIGPALPTREHPDVQFSNYGYGWFLASYKGHYRVEHGGNIDGFSASTCFFPSDSVGIVVLTNQNASVIPAIVRNIVADRMLRLSLSDWNKEMKEAADKRKKNEKETAAKATSSVKKGTKPSHLPEELEGKYSLDGYGTFSVKAHHDSLFAKMGNYTYWLKHFHYDIFQPFEVTKKHKIDTANKSDMRLNFITGLNGEVERVAIYDMEPSLNKPLEFLHHPDTKEIKPERLKEYVGEYEIAGMVAKVYVKAEKNLFLFVPGQPEYELAYLGGDKFALKILSGYKLEFVHNGEKVSGCFFIQPNGTFKATRK
ncbi:MAG: serine hydrolase [Bacteroidetes bacterium]|nr:serine hydrolase [Bacteroidota bacterium]MBS1540745.1 serine hydrolase [Bacteroidota bacterium]